MADEDIKVNPFRRHFDYSLTESEIDVLSKDTNTKKSIKYPYLGETQFFKPIFTEETDQPRNSDQFSISHLRPNLRRSIESSKIDFSPFQSDLLSILTNYRDLFLIDPLTMTSRLRSNEIVYAYSLHVLNHVLKTRHRILKNHTKIRNQQNSNSSINDEDADQLRDQGLTRAKVLILVPFRYMALNVVKTMIDLLFPDQSTKKKALILNKKRFFDEYDVDEEDHDEEKERPEEKRPRYERPHDYKETFRGNIDDCFRFGISIGKNQSMKLYTEFYSSDIIVASPLGLRMAIGAEGEKEYDYDFLSSIELLIFDRTDVFQMQNWSHVLHILQHLHKQPRDGHGVDFSRVRLANLNGTIKYYRQTLIFSPILTPEIRSIFNQYCRNYEGRSIVTMDRNRNGNGSLAQVVVPLMHAFQKFSCPDLLSESEKRYEYFLQKILPQYTDSSMNGTLIYVPSYYDFVRLRNYFKKNDSTVSCVQICEYTSEKKVSRARDMFFHGDKHFLLFTERFHFYHRYRIRGIRNLIFYQLPTYAHFYQEMCNSMLDEKRNLNDKNRDQVNQLTCAVLYSQFDALRLAGVVGQEKAVEMLKSDKSVHMLLTE